VKALKARNRNQASETALIESANIISRFQRWETFTSYATWAVGPGFYIPRLWRLTHQSFHTGSVASGTKVYFRKRIPSLPNGDSLSRSLPLAVSVPLPIDDRLLGKAEPF
jgi:hypothetical protein